MFSQCSVHLLTFNQASEFNPWMYGDDCNDCNYDFDEHESQHVVVGATPWSLAFGEVYDRRGGAERCRQRSLRNHSETGNSRLQTLLWMIFTCYNTAGCDDVLWRRLVQPSSLDLAR